LCSAEQQHLVPGLTRRERGIESVRAIDAGFGFRVRHVGRQGHDVEETFEQNARWSRSLIEGFILLVRKPATCHAVASTPLAHHMKVLRNLGREIDYGREHRDHRQPDQRVSNLTHDINLLRTET
jgi:hypothetical protein